ncbi:hypothetical protein ANN_04095 [Periplaneta americana]|uniref:Uncharacterized protein n=1 Tax=Periplaneta americana TaxID=6978 RepID=A0ABQ8T8C7_PERAM|nr:hypothetical protein ANN_04095 [Periplaneta americana]
MNPRSSTESYPAFAHIGLRENPGKNLSQEEIKELVGSLTEKRLQNLLKDAPKRMVNGRDVRGRRRYQMIHNIKIYGSYAKSKRKAENRGAATVLLSMNTMGPYDFDEWKNDGMQIGQTLSTSRKPTTKQLLCPPQIPMGSAVIGTRMERVKKTDRIRNEAVLKRMGEERMMLKLISKRKRNWLGHWLRRNCLLEDVLEGMVNGRRVRGRRRYQMIHDIEIYYGLYEETKRKTENSEDWRRLGLL